MIPDTKTLSEIKEILNFNPPNIEDFICYVNYLDNYATNFLFFLDNIRYYPRGLNSLKDKLNFISYKEQVDFVFQQALNLFLLIRDEKLNEFQTHLKILSLNVLNVANEHLEKFSKILNTHLRNKILNLDFS